MLALNDLTFKLTMMKVERGNRATNTRQVNVWETPPAHAFISGVSAGLEVRKSLHRDGPG